MTTSPIMRARRPSASSKERSPFAQDRARTSEVRTGHETVCIFWLGERAYGISTALVGEVVQVEGAMQVPLAPPGVIGMFNLRGQPVALVDTGALFELPDPMQRAPGASHALVVRRDATPIAGLVIERMDTVSRLDQGGYTPRDWAADHAAVAGFLELAERRLVVTVFDSDAVMKRLEALKAEPHG